MIWDTFLFNGEEDLLNIRRAEMDGAVSHVSITGNRTFSGDGSAAAGDVTVDLEALAPFDAERRQRGVVDDLAAEHPDDLFLHGDVDEIPRASAVLKAVAEYRRPVRLRGDLHQHRLDWWLPDHADEAVHPFAGPVLARGRDITAGGGTLALRQDTSIPEMRHSGWHLQWVMSPDECVRKIRTFAHDDFCRPPFTEPTFWRFCSRYGVDPLGRWTLEPSSDLPTASERFSHLLREAA